MKKKYIMLFLLFITKIGTAQIDSFWVDVDTSQVSNYEEIVEELFAPLNKAEITTGILYDRVPGMSNARYLTGSIMDTTSATFGDWLQVYMEMHLSHLTIPTLPTYAQLAKKAIKTHDSLGVISIGLINYNYNQIKDYAIDSNLIAFSGDQVIDVVGRNESPYATRRVFLLTPLIDTVRSLNLKFKVDSTFFSGNEQASWSSFEIDFGDGNGYREVLFGSNLSINYFSGGRKPILTRITYADFTLFGKTSIEIDAGVQSAAGDNKLINGFSPDLDFYITPDRAYDASNHSPNSNSGSLRGRVGVWFGRRMSNSPCISNDNIIRKPIIFLMGFDPLNLNSEPKEYYDDVNRHKFLDALRAEGYDIIITDNQNGGDYVQNNGFVLEKVLRMVNGYDNTMPQIINTTNHENIVVGYSAGAMGARYILSLLEKEHLEKGKEHPRVRSLFLVEGEHQGCNIPMGLQYFVISVLTATPVLAGAAIATVGPILMAVIPPHIATTLGVLIATGLPVVTSLGTKYINNEVLESHTARQLLRYHYSMFGTKEHPERTQLMWELKNNLNHAGTINNGYPTFPRLIGIANGSSHAVASAWRDGMKVFDLDLITSRSKFVEVKHEVEYFALDDVYFSTAYRTKSAISVLKGFFRPINLKMLPYINVLIFRPELYDQAPASNLDMHITAYDIFNEFNKAKGGLFTPGFKFSGLRAEESFAPTVSVFDLHNSGGNQLSLNHNVNSLGVFWRSPTENTSGDDKSRSNFGYPHLRVANAKKITPFDAVFASVTNDEHVGRGMTVEAQGFLADEIAPVVSHLTNREIGSTTNYLADFEARNIIVAGNKVYEPHDSHKSPEGDFIVGSNSEVTFSAGEYIVLKDGFRAVAGCDFHAFTEPYLCYGVELHNDGDMLKDRLAGTPFEVEKAYDNDDLVYSKEESKTEEADNTTKFNVYPNPTNGTFMIQAGGEELTYQVSVLDFTGRELISKTLTQSTTAFDISTYPKGIYFVTLSGGSEFYVKKLVYQ